MWRDFERREAEHFASRSAVDWSLVQVDPELVLAAAVSSRRDRISFWDALILAAASAAGCEDVLSEDLQHGRSFGQVRIADPFRGCQYEVR